MSNPLGEFTRSESLRETGLDDGPPLPTPQALQRAYKRIERSTPRTDAERMNWLEKVKYAQLGIESKNGRWQVVILLWQKKYYGRSLRGAIDAAMGELCG